MLGDEITKAVYGSQWVCTLSPGSNQSDHLLQQQRNLHWTKLNDCNAHIQVYVALLCILRDLRKIYSKKHRLELEWLVSMKEKVPIFSLYNFM